MADDSKNIRIALNQLQRIEASASSQAAKIASLESKLSNIENLGDKPAENAASSATGPEEALDPVAVGDFLLLRTIASSQDNTHGYLCGDAAFERVGVQQQPDKHRTALNAEDYVFRVCPMLNYRQRLELELAKASAAVTPAPSGEDDDGSEGATLALQDDEEARALNLLKSRVVAEEKRNAQVMESVVGGAFNGGVLSAVKYGDVIQLQHVSTGGFVSALEAAAPCDPECRAVHLDHSGSSAALFKFMPRYKAQAVGSIVYYSHSVVLESVKQRGMMLHTSAVAYSDIPSVENAALPKCLQTGKTLETNLSPQYETFTVAKFARFGPKDSSLLKTSVPFRLYHSQSEAFVHASCNPEKDRAHPEGRQGDEASGGPEMTHPCHVPYLKKLPQTGESPDPTDPSHHSAKGVWCFEPLQRSSASTLSWDAPCRVRHVPSGRYLCVDHTASFTPADTTSNVEGEVWYPSYLVDDETTDGGSGFNDLDFLEGGVRGFKAVSAPWMTFSVSSADVKTSDGIPDADIGLRLEHTLGSGQRLYLHNTEERKPQRADKSSTGSFTSSTGVVFSTVRSSQDIFKVMRVAKHEAEVIRAAKSFQAPTTLYSSGASDMNFSLASGILVNEAIACLLKIVGMQIKGGLHGLPPPGEKWIKLANSTLPAAFSAMFGGARDSFVQRIFRDTKLMDSVFAMGVAMYAREDPLHARIPPETDEEKAPLRAVQKLVHVALQRLVEGETVSQDYFGRRVSPSDGKAWMQTIMEQLEDPLGAAVTLSKLLGANEKLMEKYADSTLVLRFAGMVRDLGPQPRLVNFFEAICTAGSKPVKTNQEMVLRLTWMNEEWRKKVYLMTAAFPHSPIRLPPYGDVLDPSGNLCQKHDGKAASRGAPADYIGKATYESDEGFPPVFVQWAGSDSWKQGVDELFWAPSKLGLGIPVYVMPDDSGGSSQWVRIEDLCWIQDKQRLCRAVTGKDYDEVRKAAKADPALAAALKAQSQFVDYFVGQLLLFSQMCFGRSYNVITWLSRTFSYEMLNSMFYNPYLPPRVRGAACTLVQSLYLDRYPQLPYCGRARLPELLWVFESTKGSKDTGNTIKSLTLAEEGSLAEFGLAPDHPFQGNPDPFLSFPAPFKFYLLRNFGNKFLAGFGGGTLVSTQEHETMMARTVMNLIDTLASFGFQSSLPKIKDLLQHLVPILDGRSDAAMLEEGNNYVPFEPLTERFKLTSKSMHATGLKTNIIQVLISISNLRAQFRLANLLKKFKEYTEKPNLRQDLLDFHKLQVENKMHLFGQDRALMPQLFQDFEKLFTKDDGLALQLEKLAGSKEQDAPINEILVDCLMYEDDDLFTAALELLERTFGQRRKLRDAFSAVTLLDNEVLPVFGSVATLRTTLSYLTFLSRSSEVWGVNSKVSGPFEEGKFKTVCENAKALAEFIFAGSVGAGQPNPRNQETLRAANAHGTLTIALDMNYNISFEGSICSSEDKVQSRDWITTSMRMLVACLKDFVAGNPQNQSTVWAYLSGLRKHLGPLKLPKQWPSDFPEDLKSQVPTEPRIGTEEVVVECLRNNTRICEFEVPKSLIQQFGSLLNAAPDPSAAVEVEFFSLLCQPQGGKPLPRNQAMVLDVLLEDHLEALLKAFHSLFSASGHSNGAGDAAAPTELSKPELLLDMLTATIVGKNLKTATMLTQVGGLEATVETLAATMQRLQESARGSAGAATAAGGGGSAENVLAEDPFFGSLLSFLSEQLSVLVVDPKLFRLDRCWDLVSVGVRSVLSAAAAAVVGTSASFPGGGSVAPPPLGFKVAHVAAAAANVAFVFVDGARSLGLSKQELERKDGLETGQGSVLFSASALASSSALKKHFPALAKACNRVATLLKPARAVLASFDGGAALQEESKNDDDDQGQEEEEKDDAAGEQGGVEMKARGKRSSTITGLHSRTGQEGGVFVVDSPWTGPLTPEDESPAVLRRYFSEALAYNPQLNNAISVRRFALVECLETAGSRTGVEAAGVVPGADGRGSVKIEWLDLVGRMVDFVKAHNFDKDQSKCARVFRVLQSYLLKSRCDDSGAEKDPIDLKEHQRVAYFSKQDQFVKCGVVDVVLTAIATHAPGSLQGELAEGAIDLVMELLNGSGTGSVQEAVMRSIDEDPGSKFLLHLKGRLLGHLSAIEERKEGIASAFRHMSTTQRAAYLSCTKTFILLKLLCEGHHRQAQDALREQRGKSVSVNLVALAVQVLAAQVEERSMLPKMEDAEVELLCTNLDFLIEATQGPCPGNQELVVGVEGFTSVVEKIIQSKFHKRVSTTSIMEAKEASVRMLLSCLEGRRDNAVHRALASELEPEMLDMLKLNFARVLVTSKQEEAPKAEYDERELITMETLAMLKNITDELCPVSTEFADKVNAVLSKKSKKGDLVDEINVEIAVVEVLWHDLIESVAFPVPRACGYLTESTKEEFFLNCDLSNNEKRMKQLLEDSPMFDAEMKQVYELCSDTPFSATYSFIHANLSTLKWGMYGTVAMLNINLVMASYGANSDDGYNTLVGTPKKESFYASLYISLVLAAINLAGYVVVMTFSTITEVPIIIRRLDEYVSDCEDDISMKLEDYRDPHAFDLWFVTLIANILFIIMHRVNTDPNVELYLVLILGINMPWTLRCVRNYIVVPNTPQTRLFTVIYDVIVSKPFFRNNVILMFFSILGFVNTRYFAFMLLDILNLSQTLGNVIRSVTDNILSLGLVLYLIIAMVIIYAQFGLENFEDWFVYDGDADDEASKGCHSAVACAFLIFYAAVPATSLSEVMDPPYKGDPDFIARMFFDISFFILVGILLFNIITGLMVDGFGALRDEDNERAELLENVCFVCGFARETYDELPNFKTKPSFDVHKDQDHSYWFYVYFYVYLKQKRKTELSGVESYVWSMLQVEDPGWVPTRNSAALQAHKGLLEEKNATKGEKSGDEE